MQWERHACQNDASTLQIKNTFRPKWKWRDYFKRKKKNLKEGRLDGMAVHNIVARCVDSVHDDIASASHRRVDSLLRDSINTDNFCFHEVRVFLKNRYILSHLFAIKSLLFPFIIYLLNTFYSPSARRSFVRRTVRLTRQPPAYSFDVRQYFCYEWVHLIWQYHELPQYLLPCTSNHQFSHSRPTLPRFPLIPNRSLPQMLKMTKLSKAL